MIPIGPVEIWHIGHASTLGLWMMTLSVKAFRTRKRRPQTRIDVRATARSVFHVSKNDERTVATDDTVVRTQVYDGVVQKNAPAVEELLRTVIAQLARSV